MAKLEDQKDDVLVQGEQYEEDDDDDILDQDSGPRPERRRERSGSPMKTIAIVGGIIVLLVLVVFGGSKIIMPMMEAEESTEYETEPFEYMPQEIEALRMAGFTGDEIEEFELQEADVGTLINEQKAKREAQYESEVAPYRDSTSPEFKELQAMTWLGQEDLNFDPTNESEWKYRNSRLNLDYTKVPAKGYQCFLRLTIDEGDEENGIEPKYAFMNVEPVRYSQLPEKGNINVNIDYYYLPTEKTTIITGLKEIRATDN